MSLKHALLGFLNYGPMTGYELKKFFDTSVAHFWNAELSQIYPSLKQLESEGLVEMQVDVQEDRPNRKVYTITEDGRSELVEWLASPAENEQVREPVLIKVFFGAALSKQEIIGVLRRQIEDRSAYLQALEGSCAMISAFANAIGLKRDALFWGLTVEAGITHHRAEVDWAKEAIRRIEAADDSLFTQEPAAEMDVKTATEALERLKKAIPEQIRDHSSAGGSPQPVAENEKSRRQETARKTKRQRAAAAGNGIH